MMSILVYFSISILGLIAIFVLANYSETNTIKTEIETDILITTALTTLDDKEPTTKDEIIQPIVCSEGFCESCLNYHHIYDGKCSICIDRCD